MKIVLQISILQNLFFMHFCIVKISLVNLPLFLSLNKPSLQTYVTYYFVFKYVVQKRKIMNFTVYNCIINMCYNYSYSAKSSIGITKNSKYLKQYTGIILYRLVKLHYSNEYHLKINFFVMEF